MFHTKIGIILLSASFIVVLANEDTCTTIDECGACIRQPSCIWCNNIVFEELNHKDQNSSRCNTRENHMKNEYCKDKMYLEDPKSSVDIRKNESTMTNRNGAGKPRHISPQIAAIKLKVGQYVEIPLKYVEAEDKPLDLYYIMDLSATMKDDKDTVAAQGQQLADALKSITNDTQIGFGSFIDKPVMPFVSSTQLKGADPHSVIPYGFKNHLKMTAEIEKFKDKVNAAKISANLDAPEGGLDAIMQAISCEKEIGWRSGARKLIVMATDGPFHIAGDAKLGGIVKPNDRKCHMQNNIYTHSTLLDYPSVAQLNSKVLEKQVNIIFAVSEHLSLYQQLSQRISGSAAAALSSDSTNVVNLVKKEYEKISQTVKLEGNVPRYLKVTYFAKCINQKDFVPSGLCENVGVGKSVDFKIRLELLRCPDQTETERKISISTFQLRGKEALLLDIEPLCSCSCNNNEKQIKDPAVIHKYCSGSAKYMACGQCNCDDDHRGRNCQCSKVGGGFKNITNCINPKSNLICENRGDCDCGKCKCNVEDQKLYSGRYCECDDSMCLSILNGRSCSDQGTCSCGKCNCQPNFEGDKCECPKTQITCIEPGKKEVCNGQGKCSCESQRECKCNPNFSGMYCQKCNTGCENSTQIGSRCEDPKLKECIICHLDNFEKTSGQQLCLQKCQVTGTVGDDITSYDVSVRKSVSDERNQIQCQLRYNSSCTTTFAYSYNPEPNRLTLTVQVQEPKGFVCIAEPPILWYIFGVVGAVLLIGILLLLLWKLVTYLHDTREYTRFEKERADAKWDAGENPLYSNPMSTFKNPAYTS